MDKEFLTKALLAEFQHCESLDFITAGEESRAVDSEFFECVDNAYGRLDIDKLIDDYGLDTITDKYPEFGEMCRQRLKEVEEDSEIGERDLTKEGTKGAEEEAEEPPLAPDDESPPISLKDDVEKRIVEGENTGKDSFNNQVREEDGYVKELIEDQQTKPSAVSAPQFGMFQGDDAFVDVGYKGFASGNQILIRNGAQRKTFTLLGDNTIAINGKRFPIHKNDDGSVFAGWKSVQNTNGKIQIEGQTLTLSEDKKEVSGLWKAFPNQKVFVFPADMRKGKYVANLVEQTGRQPYESPESVNGPETYDTAGSPDHGGESQFFQNPIIGGAAGAAAGTIGAEKAAGASSNNTVYTGHKDRYGEGKTSASQNGAGDSGYTPNWTYGNKTERDAKAAKERAKEEAKRRGEKSAFGNGAGKDGVRFTGASFYTKQRVENITAARGIRGTLQDQGKLMRSAFARKSMAQARRVSLSADDYKVLSQNYYQILHINTNNAKALKNDITLKTRYLSRETKNELKEARKELSKFGLTDNYLKLKEKLERGEFLGDQKKAAEKYLKAQEKANEEVIRKGFFDSKNKGKLEVGGFAASLKLLEENKRLSVPKTKKELEEKIKKMENSKMGLSKTDEKATLVGAFKESDGVVYHDKRITYDNLSESQFSPIDSYGDAGGPVFELHYNGPDEWMGYSLEAVDYETSLVYCKQGKNPEDESYSALVKAYENVEPTPGVIGKNHYPIVLSDKQLDYLNEVMFLDVQIGDVLPFSFYQTFSFRASFVLVDSYSAGNSVARGDLSSLPPAILPSSAVQCFHENVGLFSDAFESSIGRAFERLDTYIDDNGVDLEKTGRNENYRFTEHTFKSASSVGMRFYPSEAELPLEESLCIYWGQLPANEDEIMVPSKDVFDYLSPNGANASKLAGIFDEYTDGFPLAVEEGAYAGFSLPHLKIVGAYEPLGPAMRNSSGEIILNEDGTPKRPFFTSFCCPTIVHDNVYAGAWKYDFEEGRHFRTRGYGDVISSDRLLQNFDLLQDGTIVQVANEIRFEQALSMTRGLASFCQILAYVLLAVSAIIHFIYGGIVIGRLLELNDRYVRFWNVGKKAVTASCLSAIGFLALPSFALALIVAPPAFLGLTYQLPRLNGFSFQIMCQTGIGYAFLAVALFVTALVAGLTLLLGMKKYGNKRQKHLENI